MKRGLFVTALGVLSSAFLVACSSGSSTAPAGAAPTSSEVKVSAASGFKFNVPTTAYKVGQTYKFTVTNTDVLPHEFALLPKGEMDHSKALAFVPDTDFGANKTVTKEVKFDKPGTYEIACHVPGHYEAGMKVEITVS